MDIDLKAAFTVPARTSSLEFIFSFIQSFTSRAIREQESWTFGINHLGQFVCMDEAAFNGWIQNGGVIGSENKVKSGNGSLSVQTFLDQTPSYAEETASAQPQDESPSDP